MFGLSGDPAVSGLVGDGDAARALSERMQGAWLAFAREGKPAAEGLPEWRPYDDARRATLILGAECRAEEDPLGSERELWGELV